MNSCYSNDTSVIKLLLKHTNNINQKNKKGKSSLTIAVESNNLETIKFLIKNGGDVNIKDNYGNNLMYYLIKNYRSFEKDLIEEKINYLIKQGLNPTENQGNGKTILHLAVENGSIDLIEKIFSFGVDINALDKDNLTALHIAASKAKDLTVLNWLIKNGAKKNIKSSFGETAFDLANENEILTNKKININFLKN
jgi:ankyrin repeat protein